jgi:hypothetical protein
MTEQPELIPTGDNRMLDEVGIDRKITWLERTLGTDNYRIVKGLFKTRHRTLALF